MNKRLKLKPTNILATAPSPSKNQRHLHRNFPTTAIRTLISFLVLTCTTPLSLGYKGGGPGGITTVTTTLSSPQASTSAAKYKALDNTVSYADVSNLQKTAPSVQEEQQQEQEQQTTSKNDKDHSSTTHTQIIHLPRKENDQHGQKMMMDGGEYTEEDQKFLDRVRASVRTVQNWDADVELLKQCREVIPWDDLRNNTTTTGSSSGGGPYSSEHDRLLVDNPNALFLQRLARWFPTFMSWVNAPPCRVCGSTACEMKTVRGPITDEEKEGEAKRVEGTTTNIQQRRAYFFMSGVFQSYSHFSLQYTIVHNVRKILPPFRGTTRPVNYWIPARDDVASTPTYLVCFAVPSALRHG